MNAVTRAKRRFQPAVFAAGTAFGIGVCLWLLVALGWIII